MSPSIVNKLGKLPEKSGVYVLKDNAGQVIYVSRTTNIKQQVKYHLSNSETRKNATIKKHLADIEWFVIEDRYEATTLELQLIKKYHPPLNGRRKDEKQYRFIRLTMSESFPRVKVIKLNEPKGERIIGPFPKNRYVKRVFSWAVNYFEIADCGKNIILGENSVTVQTCLRRKLDQCLRPCELPVEKELYKDRISKFINFFEGKDTEFLDLLTQQMQETVDNQEYEQAAQIRDKIAAIKKVIRFSKAIDED